MASPTVDYVIRATDQTAQAFRNVDRNVSKLSGQFSKLAGASVALFAADRAQKWAKATLDAARAGGDAAAEIEALDRSFRVLDQAFIDVSESLVREVGPAVAQLVEQFANAIPRAIAATEFAIVAVRQKLVEFAADVTDFFGGDDVAAALRDQAAAYTTEVQKAFDQLESKLNTSLSPSTREKGGGKGRGGGKSEAQKAAEAEARELAALFESTRGPVEQFGLELEKLDAWLARGAISTDVYNVAVGDLQVKYAGLAQSAALATEAGQAWTDSQARAAEIVKATETPLERLTAQLEEINRLQAGGFLGGESADRATRAAGQDYAEALAKSAEETNKLAAVSDRVFQDIEGAAAGAAGSLVDLMTGAAGNIGDVFERLAVQIAQSLFQATVVDGIAGAIGGGIKAAFGRSIGGSVAAGTPYLVGERGPELFVPRQGGRIVPNSGGEAQPVNVTFNVNSLDPGTAAGVIQANRQQIVGMIRGAVQRTGSRPRLA